MKVIISHDIDHLYWTDHLLDLFIPKFIVKNTLNFLRGKCTINEYQNSLALLLQNRQNRLNELIDFNEANGIKATYFVGMANGLGLSYSRSKAFKIIKFLKSKGIEVGVHGIAFNNKKAITEEKKRFSESGYIAEGIRIHYLRNDQNTLKCLAEAGYLFDSTIYEQKNPYLDNNGIMEFPVSAMDVYDAPKSINSVVELEREIKLKLNLAIKRGLTHYTIIFHDLYFDKAFSNYFTWYKSLVKVCKEMNLEFINFKDALNALNHG